MKKRWIAGLLVFISFPVLAESPFSYYAGLSAGVNVNSASMDQSLDATIGDLFIATPSIDANTNHFGAIGQLQVGAGYQYEVFYLGAELSGQFFDGDFDNVNSELTDTSPLPLVIQDETQLSLNDFEVALDLKPGIFLYDDILLYARIGVAANELTLDQTSAAIDTVGNHRVDLHHSKSDNVYPLRLGLGLERRFTEDLSVAFDYIYTQYDDISANGFIPVTFPDSTVVSLDGSSKVTDISRQTVMLALNYYFQ